MWPDKKYFLLTIVLLLFTLSSCEDRSESIVPDISPHPGARMIVMGDCRDGDQVLDRLTSIILGMKPFPVLVVFNGDMVGRAGDEVEWAIFHETIFPLENSLTLLPVAGNHDIKGPKTREIYRKQFSLPGGRTFYRYDLDNLRIIVLDGTFEESREAIAGEQLIWLENQMDVLAGDSSFKIVFCHYPVFRSEEGDKEPLRNADNLHQLFVKAGVQAVFTSHDHVYDHQVHDGIDYFISGGAGADMVDGTDHSSFFHLILLTVGQDEMWVEVIDLNGEVVREIIIDR